VQEARRAIAADRSVRFSYRGRADSAPMDRHVDPWALDLVDGAWYLHGADRGLDAPRIFRLDRSSGLTLADEPRVTPAPVDLPVPRYEPAPDDLEVELRLEQGAAWLLDALTVDATLESDRQLVVRLRTGDPEWLARLVLMAGGGAEVIAPDMLRRIVRDRARRALGLAAAAETMRD
jgi:predicted DNA-binding transcriptional regulator YafY